MPTYTFKLSDDSDGVEDNTGVTLPGAEAALRYACDVVTELMDRREDVTRTWRLDVYEGARKVFEIPFASFDRSLDHLRPQHRDAVELICEQRRSLKDAVSEAKVTRRETQALVARSCGKPYLVTQRGQKVIRDER
jgi:hypothetical protein